MKIPNYDELADSILVMINSRFQSQLNDANQKVLKEDIRTMVQAVWRSGYYAGEQDGPRREDMGR